MTIVSVLSAVQTALSLDPSRALTQYSQRIWQVQQGLPDGAVYCMHQTRDRHLWLGTGAGLVTFDGVQFTVIRKLDYLSLENVRVRDLAEDDQHNLLVATDSKGLIRWRAGVAKRFSQKDGLPSDNIRCVFVDRTKNVWIGTERGLARLVGDRIECVTGNDVLSHEPINAIGETADGTIWVAGDRNQLFAGRGDDFSLVPVDSMTETSTISALLGRSDGSLWIGTSVGLVRLHEGKQRCFTIDDGLADNHVYCLLEGAGGHMWIGTGDGFSRLRNGEFQSFRTRNGLSQSTVCDICEDHEGSLWVGTRLGLNQFVDRRTMPISKSEGLPSNSAGPVQCDTRGNTWIGTLDAGLSRYDGANFLTLTTDDGLPSNEIRSLAAGDDGSLWVGTDRGLCQLRDEAVVLKLTIHDGLPSNRIQALHCDYEGTLWIGTSHGLVGWRDGQVVQPPQGKEPLERSPIVCIAQDGDGIVVATEYGSVVEIKDGQQKRLDLHQCGPLQLSALCSDGETLFVGTLDNGLYIIDRHDITHVTVQEGLYDDEIFGILADPHDQLWFACSKGIFSVHKSLLRAFAAGKADSIQNMSLSSFDVLRTIECQRGVQPLVQLMPDGRIWFSMIRGLVVVDPLNWPTSLPPTSVVIDDLVINGKFENALQPQSIPPGNANLTFRYTALSYFSPLRIKFRYRLEGFDEDWIEAGTRREAFYTNIPPGTYRFIVSAVNVDGKVYATAAPVELRIAPHPYQTVWFWVLCGVAVALAVWTFFRLRVRRVRQQMNVIMDERSRIARELHDGLMQGFSGITMQMQALSKRLPSESPQHEVLTEIIGDAGHCMREARQSIAGLRGGQSGLAAAIGQAAQQLTQTQDVRLKLHLAPVEHRLSAETEYNLLRIAQEAITNALKHSGGRIVDVALEDNAGEICLIIRDDGRGFIDRDEKLIGLGHYGLIGMRERARHIGADFSLQSYPGRGTTVRVALPPHHAVVGRSA